MKDVMELRDEYLSLLEDGLREQVYQSYIEENSVLVPRDFVQNHGLHLSLALRKLRIGGDYVSDFFFLSKSSDDWNVVFIEIEKPTSRFFKDGGQDFHPDFEHALQQVGSWRAWLSIEGNLPSFLNQLSSIRVPTMMQRNPTFPKFILVFGRRAEYQSSELRRSRIRSEERDDFKIITFDSLAEGLSSKSNLWLGVRRNEFIDIQNNDIVDDNLFTLVDPHALSVNQDLYNKLKEAVAQNKPSPLKITGHISHNFRKTALDVKVRSKKQAT